jgi:hypothetical protein
MAPAPHVDPEPVPVLVSNGTDRGPEINMSPVYDGLVPTGWEDKQDPAVEPWGPVQVVNIPEPTTDPQPPFDHPTRGPFVGNPGGMFDGINPDDAVEPTAVESFIMNEIATIRDEQAALHQAMANFGERQDWMIKAIGQALAQFQAMMAGGGMGMLGKMLGMGGKRGKDTTGG